MNPTRETPSRTWRPLTLLVALLTLSSSASACGGNDDSATATVDENMLIAAVDALAAVCIDGDHARLRDLSSPGIHDRLRDQDNVFNANVEDITVVDHQVDVDGDSAAVAVTLDVTIDGETSDVEAVWEYERVDDTWGLSAVPACP